MKSLAELKAIRDRAKANVALRQENPNAARVLVGMATCGIAAGARPVLNAFTEEIAKRGLRTTSLLPRQAASAFASTSPLLRLRSPAKKR